MTTAEIKAVEEYALNISATFDNDKTYTGAEIRERLKTYLHTICRCVTAWEVSKSAATPYIAKEILRIPAGMENQIFVSVNLATGVHFYTCYVSACDKKEAAQVAEAKFKKYWEEREHG